MSFLMIRITHSDFYIHITDYKQQRNTVLSIDVLCFRVIVMFGVVICDLDNRVFKMAFVVRRRIENFKCVIFINCNNG